MPRFAPLLLLIACHTLPDALDARAEGPDVPVQQAVGAAGPQQVQRVAPAAPGAGSEAAPEEPPGPPLPLPDRWALGAPVTHGALTLWPVLDARPRRTDVDTLADALAAGTLTIAEVDASGSVPTLRVHNTGKRAVLLTAGEVVTGGKQDRILAEDLLVAPGPPREVAVNCVEQGRWVASARGTTFGYGGRGEVELKKTVKLEKSQSATWAKVAEANEEKKSKLSAGVAGKLEPATGTYMASLGTKEVGDLAAPYVAALGPALAGERVAGVVAAYGGKVGYAEVFGSPTLFARSRDGILRSLALDAIDETAAPRPPDADASAFLADALSGRTTMEEAAPDSARLERDGARNKAVELRSKDGELLHLDAFAD